MQKFILTPQELTVILAALKLAPQTEWVKDTQDTLKEQQAYAASKV